jgi:1,4-alpha-glucan branching enzyme
MYLEYLAERISFLEGCLDELRTNPPLLRIAKMYFHRFSRCREIFEGVWKRDMVAVLARLQRSGILSLVPSAATHAYFPLWTLYPELIELQIRIGLELHKQRFGGDPKGFWLPECGFVPGIDKLLAKSGVNYFFVDTHGITYGTPKPKYEVYAPVFSPAGPAVFGRDWRTHDIVWRDTGYPGDNNYLRFRGDMVSELAKNNVWPETSFASWPSGMRCWRRWPPRQLYDPQAALGRCMEHAQDFLQRSVVQIAEIAGWLPRPPAIVGSFDVEHFGHWWYEGPAWLDLVIRKFACEDPSVSFVTADEYLQHFPENQEVNPAQSSWGYQGYNESWLMGRNHWIYPELFDRADRLRRLAQDSRREPLVERALAEYIRELLQAQASDWPYMMHAYPDMHYATQRIRDHLEAMDLIEHGIEGGSLEEGWLIRIEQRNTLFRDIDVVGMYRKILHSA